MATQKVAILFLRLRVFTGDRFTTLFRLETFWQYRCRDKGFHPQKGWKPECIQMSPRDNLKCTRTYLPTNLTTHLFTTSVLAIIS